ncbi:MAG: S41 family peptidase [Pyrinomonadaceae bacterium MAG19_C2-C3]|nr:S41 family peptidase [Pyrinomonadaceae bacterium MAG19_C2-C3]
MYKRFHPALTALLLLTLSTSGFSQTPQPTAPQGRTAAPNAATPPPRVGRLSPEEALRRLTRTESSSASAATAGIEADYAEALTIVEDNYIEKFGENKLDYANVTKSAVIGMLRSLDPHSNFYDAQEFDEMRSDQRSEYFGIGASINNWKVKDKIDTYIMATFENSPAARAGLRFGDKIISVDGQVMTGKPSSDVRDKIRGPRGSRVKVTVERASTGANETVEIVRDAVAQPSVPDAYMIRPGVGYVDMTRGFNYTTSNELGKALESLRAQGMTQLVLDLRGNPGGFLDQAKAVAEKFLQPGQKILTQKGREAERVLSAENPRPDTTPLVVLINRGSASASEIVAGALQDHDRALIIGENSFGKGLVQSIINLDYGAGLTLTSAKYYTPSGRLIQRDYSNGSLYDYYTRGEGVRAGDGAGGAPLSQTPQPPTQPSGDASRTDSGRTVYSGGGITPDETVATETINRQQIRLLDSIFAFSRELANGRIAGFDSYKIQRAIDYDHNLQATDFPVTNEVFAALKKFVAAQPSYQVTETQLDRNRAFVAQRLRFDLVTAAYGSTIAQRVLLVDEPQTTKAVAALPRARDLAAAAQRGRNPVQKSFE